MTSFSRSLLLICAALVALTSCSKLDPTQPIKADDVKAALKQFSKKEISEISQMGGTSYLIGKTVNGIKATLEEDYENHKADEYINAHKLYRDQNLELAKDKKLTVDNIKLMDQTNPNEKKLAVREVQDHLNWLNKVSKAQKAPDPQEMVTPAKGTMACGDFQSTIQYYSPDTKDAVKKRLTSRKVCRPIPKALEYYIRDTKADDDLGTFYRIRAGWIPEKAVIARTSPEKLEELKAQQKANFEKMLGQPPAQVYSSMRPLVDVSPQDLHSLLAAEDAIAVLASKKNIPWDQAAQEFVRLELAKSKAEVPCLLDSNCDELTKLDRQHARLLMADKPKGFKKEALPCEVLPISGCKKVLSEKEAPSKEF